MKALSTSTLASGVIALSLWIPPALSSHGYAETQKPLDGKAQAANPLDNDFKKYISDLLERWHVPGVAVAVIDGDNTWTQGYGLADVESKTPVTPHTLYFGCSTTKAFTGATVATLIDSGKYHDPSFPGQSVTWETPIANILPDDFVLQDSWATTHLTLEDSLTHRSGLPRHDESYGGYNFTLQGSVRSLRYLPLNAAPRTKYQYCNLMFMVASYAVETLTGRRLEDVIRDWIWKPLGMDETFFLLKDARDVDAHVATGYYWDPNAERYQAMPYMPLEHTSGAGAILSSVSDYAKWVRALINEAEPLSKAVHKTIKTPRIFEGGDAPFWDSPSGYALGWQTTSYKGHQFFKHEGGADAWGTCVTFIPGLKFGVIAFANTGITSNIVEEILTFKLIDDKIGLPQDKRPDWPGFWEDIIDGIQKRKDQAKDVLYPDRPKVPIRQALPLESYAGTYYHPAFRNTTITVAEGTRQSNAKLAVRRPDATWELTGELEHVSGEYWILYSWLTSAPVMSPDFSPVEFKLAPDGTVAGLEIEFVNQPKGKGNGLTTFEKIA